MMLVLIILTLTLFSPYFWIVRKLELQEKVATDTEKSYLNTMKKNQHEEN